MSNVDRYIPLAFEAIQKVKLKGKDGNEYGFVMKEGKDKDEKEFIPKVYKGYVSSLGANIIQAGVKTAVYFYEAKEGSSKGDKRLITAALRYMLYPDEQAVAKYEKYKLSEKITGLDAHGLQNLSLRIMDAATALKLALRTYKME
jgi:CRISPR-associated protein Cmr5